MASLCCHSEIRVVQSFKVCRVTYQYAVFVYQKLFQFGSLVPFYACQHKVGHCWPYAYAVNAVNVVSQPLRFFQQSVNISYGFCLVLCQIHPRFYRKCVYAPWMAHGLQPAYKLCRGRYVAEAQAGYAELLRHGVYQYDVARAGCLAVGYQFLVGVVFIALVYHEDVVFAACCHVQQLFSCDNRSSRVVRIADPVSSPPFVSAVAAGGLASEHSACIGIFAECGCAYYVHAAPFAASGVGKHCRKVYCLGGTVGNHYLVAADSIFVCQCFFQRVWLRFWIAAYHVHAFGQVSFKTAQVGMRIYVGAEVRLHLQLIFIYVVAVSVNHRCCFEEFCKQVAYPRCGV